MINDAIIATAKRDESFKSSHEFQNEKYKTIQDILLLLKNAKMPLDAMKITQDKSLIEQCIFYKKRTMTS